MIVGQFTHEAALVHAVSEIRQAGLGPVETFTPAPLSASDGTSRLPVIILLGGVITGAASFLLQCYSAMLAYPFDIGGRPDFAWPSYIPTVFENAILGAIGAGFLGFVLMARLPKLYDPVDDIPIMRNASRDGWMVQLCETDAEALGRARTLMLDLGAVRVEEHAA